MAENREFQAFISFKNTVKHENGEVVLTPEAVLAGELYAELERRGIHTFFSPVTLATLGIAEYKPAIRNACEESKVMIVLGSSCDNICSKWVEYEWGGFHNDMLSGLKPDASLVSYTMNMAPSDLPYDLRGFESFQSESTSVKKFSDFVEKCLQHKPVEQFSRASHHAASPAKSGGKRYLPVVAVAAAVVLVAGIGAAATAYSEQQKANAEQARVQQTQLAIQQVQAESQTAQSIDNINKSTTATCTVRYLLKDTGKKVAEPLKVDKPVGSVFKKSAKSISGYTVSGKKTKRLTVSADEKSNVLTFWYNKAVVATTTTSTQTTTTTTPSQTSQTTQSSSSNSSNNNSSSKPEGTGKIPSTATSGDE